MPSSVIPPSVMLFWAPSHLLSNAPNPLFPSLTAPVAKSLKMCALTEIQKRKA